MRALPWLLVLGLSACSSASSSQTSGSGNWDTGSWQKVCRYDTAALPELSGLAPSVRHPGVLWAINDSGNAATVYALDAKTCQIVGQALFRAPQVDFEALASGHDRQGRPVLWIGDIGDNGRQRATAAVWEVPEPDLGTTTNTATVHRFGYPRGPVDAEGLLAAPSGRHVWVVSKEFAGTIFRVRIARGTVTAKAVGDAPGFATDAALSPGTGYAIRDYSSITRFSAPVPGDRLGTSRPPALQQAEAVAFSIDGRWLYTASEGDARLFRAPVTQ